MPSAIIYFSDEENEKIIKLSEAWGISKHETVKRIIKNLDLTKEMRKNKDAV